MSRAAYKLHVSAGQDGGSWADLLKEANAVPGILWTMLRSMVEAWPDEVYSKPIVQTRLLGQSTFFVTDPALVRSLLVDNAGALEREEIMLRALAPALGKGLLTSDGSPWRQQRRTAAPMFRHDHLRSLSPLIVAAAEATRERWLGRARPDEPFELFGEMMRTTLHVIVATMVSGEAGLDAERFGTAMEAYLGQTNWKMALAMLGLPSWLPHPGARRGSRAARYLRDSVSRILRNRRARRDDGPGSPDLLALLLAARDPETGAPMSDELLIDNLITFVAAGHETTALALTWTIRLLADHPEVERRMLDEMAGIGDLKACPDKVDGLVYTKQVLMEAMRLYPPAPLVVRRTVADIQLGPTVIRKGQSVHVPIYAVHRNEGLWNSPERFDPDRFAPALQAQRDRYAYLPFGAGPRVCIGMGLAMTEALFVLATLLPRFRLRPTSPQMPECRFRVTLRPYGSVPMIAVPREV